MTEREQCQALTKLRTRCKDWAMVGSPFCEIHDPTGKGLQNQLNRARAKRGLPLLPDRD